MNTQQINEELTIILNEMATTYSGDKLSIIVNPDDGRNLQNVQYFKVFHGRSFRKVQDLARIRFRTPEYEHHRNEAGKKDFKLNSKDKKELMRILQSPSELYDGYTIWQDTIMQFNHEAYHIPLKDCKNLTQEVINSLTNNDIRKKCLPVDLPLTDYTKL